MAQVEKELQIVFLKSKDVIDAWWFVGTEEQAIAAGKRALLGYGCNGFRVEKYGNPDIVYYKMEVE